MKKKKRSHSSRGRSGTQTQTVAAVSMDFTTALSGVYRIQGVQRFGVSGTHWKKSCLGPHIKYIATHYHKKISYCFK